MNWGPRNWPRPPLRWRAQFGGAVHGRARARRCAATIRWSHAVGQGSARAPRLIDCRWPRAGAPRVTLVGKGVCFDTGGLDLKPSAGMLLMKKDMGGAACALGLARLLLAMQAPVRIAAADSGGGEQRRRRGLPARRCVALAQGTDVEIGNTDAEGRLVLADALAEADAERPDLLIDLATLTGAARTALGPDLPACLPADAALARGGARSGRGTCAIRSGRCRCGPATTTNSPAASPISTTSQPGLRRRDHRARCFCKRFVTATPDWLHVDLYAWNPKDRPGRPLGAEAQGVRALYALIREQFG